MIILLVGKYIFFAGSNLLNVDLLGLDLLNVGSDGKPSNSGSNENLNSQQSSSQNSASGNSLINIGVGNLGIGVGGNGHQSGSSGNSNSLNSNQNVPNNGNGGKFLIKKRKILLLKVQRTGDKCSINSDIFDLCILFLVNFDLLGNLLSIALGGRPSSQSSQGSGSNSNSNIQQITGNLNGHQASSGSNQNGQNNNGGNAYEQLIMTKAFVNPFIF